MEDKEIIGLYLKRSEKAIEETERKYGKLCRKIAFNILRDHGETDESLNDTYLGIWNAIPPVIPDYLQGFVCKTARNKALHIFEKRNRKKRKADNVDNALQELAECVDMSSDVELDYERKEFEQTIFSFLENLDKKKRTVFLLRYWYFMTEKEIADRQDITLGSVKITLHRVRKELKTFLKENNYY